MIEQNHNSNDINTLGYFEEQIAIAAEMISVPFVKRKQIMNYEDPLDAINILLDAAQEVENTLKQCVEIGSFVLDKNKELIAENRKLQYNIEAI